MKDVGIMMHRILFSIVFLFVTFGTSVSAEKPKLAFVISIDGFRNDYLTRFSKHFGNSGFNLFLHDGSNFVNARYTHSKTSTGPGHAVIMSGTYPNINGIVSNTWFDAKQNKAVYCIADESSQLLDVAGEGCSPCNFFGTTVGDQLKLSNSAQSKVISISNKDRSAVLMGGKMADASFWMVDSLFITSSYYMDDLPEWVKKFNASGKVNSYFGKVWERLLPEREYRIQGPDNATGEEAENGMGRTFPHRIDGGHSSISDNYFEAFKKSPFASEVLVDFAKQAIVTENIGQRDVTDILCISFSAHDYVGHAYGPNSHEVMDLTIRTDRILEKIFGFIDEKIGLQSCTIVLTADHGMTPLPEVWSAHNKNLQLDRIHPDIIKNAAEEALTKAFGKMQNLKKWVVYHEEPNLYFNLAALRQKGISISTAQDIVKDTLLQINGVFAVYTYADLESGKYNDVLGEKTLKSFHALRSGDIFCHLQPNYIYRDKSAGTTHGSPWSYDCHVPLLWYGTGIKPGVQYSFADIVDIAPTLSVILDIAFPAAIQGRVLGELLK